MDIDPHLSQPHDIIDAEEERLRTRRDRSAWSAVIGVALLFAGSSFGTALLIGGVVMVAYGTMGYMYWSWRLSRLEDPWDDPELDAWEEEHLR